MQERKKQKATVKVSGICHLKAFYSSKERKLRPLTLCCDAEETAHKCMSVMKQKSIISFNLVNYYVAGHNMFEEPNVLVLLMTPMLLFH